MFLIRCNLFLIISFFQFSFICAMQDNTVVYLKTLLDTSLNFADKETIFENLKSDGADFTTAKVIYDDIVNADYDIDAVFVGYADDPNLTKNFKVIMALVTDINIKCNGMTALHHAVYGQNLAVIKLLIDANADLDIKDNDSYTVLMLAIKFPIGKCIEIIKLLLNSGADLNLICEASDHMGYTALMFAIDYCFDITLDIIKLLVLDYGVDVSLKNSSGKTALDLAKDEDIITFLKKESAEQILRRQNYIFFITCCFKLKHNQK